MYVAGYKQLKPLPPIPPPPPCDELFNWTHCILENVIDEDASSSDDFADELCYGTEGVEIHEDFLHPNEARRRSKAISKRIIASYNTLKDILERHESSIQRRWAKKTRSQRLRILLKAWPDMPVPHRPDYYSKLSDSAKDGKSAELHKSHFLCPYINQEDLLQSKSLPLLLNARGRHPPSVFAGSDCVTINDSIASGNLREYVLPCHSVVLNDSRNARMYGYVQTRHCHRSPTDILPSRIHFKPTEGLYILEAQDKLLSFLVQCCQEILHDIPVDDLTSDKFPILPEPVVELESDSLGLNSLKAMVIQSQYGVPAQLDLERTETILRAKAAAAEDHVLTLREDPSYFEDEITEARNHSKELLEDVYGRPDPVIVAGQESIFWARIVECMLRDAYLRLEIFSDLYRQVRFLRSLHDKYAGKFSPDDELPDDYLRALITFRFYVEQAARCLSDLLRLAATSSPPLRPYYARCGEIMVGEALGSVCLRKKVSADPAGQRLIQTMHVMWQENYPLTWNGLPFLMDVIDHILQQEPQSQCMLTAYCERMLGDVAIVAQCMRQVALYQPWARDFRPYYFRTRDFMIVKYNKRCEPRTETLAALNSVNMRHAADLAKPSQGKFAYPINRRHGRENVRVMRQSEANLDKFWAEVDKQFEKAGLFENGTSIQRLLANYRELRRTPEWVDPKAGRKAKPAQNIDTQTPIVSFSDPLEVSDSLDKVESPRLKVKVKTRGEPSKAHSSPEQAPVDASVPQGDEKKTIIPVDNRALKVFRAILCNADAVQRPGEISWVDFLHAMVSVGFRAEKLFGSVWQFSPVTLQADRSIHFHEPHPKGRLPIQIARRYGGRLHKAYGWTGDMFAVKEKSSK